MGFLNFLTKKNTKEGLKKNIKEEWDLDEPPLPPSGFEDISQEYGKEDLSKLPKIEEFPIAPPGSTKPLEEPTEALEEVTIPSVQPEQPKTEKLVIEKLKIRKRRSKSSFVDATEFKTVLKDISMIKSTIVNAHEYLSQLLDSETKKEAIFKSWHSSLVDIEKKIVIVDKTLFEKGDING